jgi:hypothetical protein
VTGIAQNYANYLLTNNVWGHTADGKDPWIRLNSSAAISACHDFLGVAENIYVAVNTDNNFGYAIEQAIYGWMYVDSGSTWGNRESILWYPYTDNNGAVGKEGFMGIGQATGGAYQGPFPSSWPFATLIVMKDAQPNCG